MTGRLASVGDDGGIIPCALCGADAAGPCGRCRLPICGDCCVLTEGTAGKWAICLDCERRGGRRVNSGWWAVGLWLLAPIAGLVVLLSILYAIWG